MWATVGRLVMCVIGEVLNPHSPLRPAPAPLQLPLASAAGSAVPRGACAIGRSYRARDLRNAADWPYEGRLQPAVLPRQPGWLSWQDLGADVHTNRRWPRKAI